MVSFWLACLTCLGAALRLWHLGGKSLWLDEGATVALARMPWRHFLWVWWSGEANLQTVYFLLMRAWARAGTGEAWMRLPSAFFGIASIPVLYFLARKFMNGGPALAAAALLAFSPAHVYYSQEARSYSLTILLVLLSSYFFVCAVEEGRSRDWLLWTLLSLIAVYTHYFAALVLVAQAASLLFMRKQAPWRSVILGGAVIFVMAIPGLTYVFRASPENLRSIWMPRPTPKEFLHLAMFFGGSGSKMGLALVLWVAGLISILQRRHRNDSAGSFWSGMLILLWIAVPVGMLAVASLGQPMFLQRYLIFSLPAAVLLAATGMDVLRKWKVGPLLVILLCVMSLPAIVKGYTKPREDWRGASRMLLNSAAPGDAVVFFPSYTRIMLRYYSDRYPGVVPDLHVFARPFYGNGEEARDLLKVLEKDPHRFRHVWILMADHGSKFENFDYGAEVEKALQAIYGAPSARKFADIDVLEYGQ